MRNSTLAAFVMLGACAVTDPPPITGVQTFQVDLVSPTDPGSETSRMSCGSGVAGCSATVNITALDDHNNVVTSYNDTLQVYVQFLGTLSPYLCFDTPGCTPLATVPMADGVANNVTIPLHSLFGPTELWFDDGADKNPSFATGTSTTLWYRDPFIADIRTVDESSLTAYQAIPLENKNVAIGGSRNGSDGRLVVTSVFSQGYTLADVLCGPGGAPPCAFTTNPDPAIGAPGYDAVEVFSYSQAEDDYGSAVHEGEVLTGFTGGATEFDGLVEIGFPQTFTSTTPEVNTALEPPAVPIDITWFSSNMINFNRYQAAALEVDNATMCPIDADYANYKQWKLAVDGNCAPTNSNNWINVITEGVVPIDPTMCVGKIFPRIVGILRPINIGSFHVWLIYPRSSMDLQLPAGDAQCQFTPS